MTTFYIIDFNLDEIAKRLAEYVVIRTLIE